MSPSQKPKSSRAKRGHGNSTARRAAGILCKRGDGFVVPTLAQKKRINIAFAHKSLVVYGRAYDIVKIKTGSQIDLDSQESIERGLADLTLYEIKSTRRELDAEFNGYFFALTTAELLVAQNLKTQYRFAFVNIRTRQHKELTLQAVLQRSRGFYPQWSISF
jgi:hypothetical protein